MGGREEWFDLVFLGVLVFVVFGPVEVGADFVEGGCADFVEEVLFVVFNEFPDVLDEEADGGWVFRIWVFVVSGADEAAEFVAIEFDIGFVVAWFGFVEEGDVFECGLDVFWEDGDEVLDFLGGEIG